MRRDRSYRPLVDSFEQRIALSTGLSLTSALTHVAHGIAPRQAHGSTLTGSISGRASMSPGIPDVGHDTLLQGEGSVGPLGHVQLSGALHSVGFIAHGHATGALTLTTPAGNVTLQLTGPGQQGFSNLPTTFRYQVIDHNGKLPAVKATGHVQVTVGPVASPQGQGGSSFTIHFLNR